MPARLAPTVVVNWLKISFWATTGASAPISSMPRKVLYAPELLLPIVLLLMFRPEFMPSSRVATRTAIASYAVSTWLFWIVRKLLLLPLAATAAPPAKMPKMLVVVPAPPPLARMLQFLIVSKVAPALVPWLASQIAAVLVAVFVFWIVKARGKPPCGEVALFAPSIVT